jgi:hypothetical protein
VATAFAGQLGIETPAHMTHCVDSSPDSFARADVPGRAGPKSLCERPMSAFSVATALVTKDISSFAAIINGLNLPVLLLAGVLLPISLGPAWMRVLAHLNPLYYAVEGARALCAGAFTSAVKRCAIAGVSPTACARVA